MSEVAQVVTIVVWAVALVVWTWYFIYAVFVSEGRDPLFDPAYTISEEEAGMSEDVEQLHESMEEAGMHLERNNPRAHVITKQMAQWMYRSDVKPAELMGLMPVIARKLKALKEGDTPSLCARLNFECDNEEDINR